MDFLCTLKIKKESQNSDHGYITNQWPYQNPTQDLKPKSATSSILQAVTLGLKGHQCSLHLQNQDRAKTWSMAVSTTRDHI